MIRVICRHIVIFTHVLLQYRVCHICDAIFTGGCVRLLGVGCGTYLRVWTWGVGRQIGVCVCVRAVIEGPSVGVRGCLNGIFHPCGVMAGCCQKIIFR